MYVHVYVRILYMYMYTLYMRTGMRMHENFAYITYCILYVQLYMPIMRMHMRPCMYTHLSLLQLLGVAWPWPWNYINFLKDC